jgi:hypothetical protein
MRILRPALLTLLLSVAGLGVPAGFAQGKSAPSKGVKKRPAASGKTSAANRKAATGSGKAASSAHKPEAPGKSAASSGALPAKSSNTARGSARSVSKRARKQPGQKAPSADRITEIQSALAKNGNYEGTPSGKWDDETTAALRKFQASRGINPSGKLDARSLQRLGLGSQTAGVAAPTPPPGAVSRLSSAVTSFPVEDPNTPR